MNRFQQEFMKHCNGMTISDLSKFLIEEKLLSEARIQAFVVNKWIDEKLKNPEKKTVVANSTRTVDGKKVNVQTVRNSVKGVVDYMYEASEYFNLSYECIRKYRYYYNQIGIS